VACAKLLASAVLLLLGLSVVVWWGWGCVCVGGGFFCPFVFLYVSASVCAARPVFSAIVKSDIFTFCRDSLSAAACVPFVKLYWLQFCEVVGVVVSWVGLLSVCSLPFLRG
jgi:hypothetical protein